ncbi:phosphatase PAP2 family protein [Catenovulum sp. 2E275]|uniref:phosphatase PAP2 family protein n=1 Tax=Catenovulum sp. 2E275 TaxID=2980497 RepID=UPI0021D11A5F|nr:phosphatase PAP2 family protein [Catenovulum sp. 2E275]MCU4676681.1 phosphatase PAP2 family protein [Catenovulum sp. 2E275]
MQTNWQQTWQTHKPSTIWLIKASGVLLLLALIIAVVFGYHAGFLTLNQFGARFSDVIWAAMTMLGDTYLAIALLLFFIFKDKLLMPAMLIASIPATIFAQGFKRGLAVDRPPRIFEPEQINQIGRVLEVGSFPSGHTMTAAVLAGLLIMSAKNNILRTLALTLVILVGISRVMVGVHFPIDTLVGGGVGLLAAGFGYLVAARFNLGQHKISQFILFCVPLYAVFRIFMHHNGYPNAHDFAILVACLALATFFIQLACHLYQNQTGKP